MSKTDSWFFYDDHSDFSIYNIPFGVAKKDDVHHLVSRIGDTVLFIKYFYELGLFTSAPGVIQCCNDQFMNNFIALGKKETNQVREHIIQFFSEKENQNIFEKYISILSIDVNEIQMMLPINIGDYTDFYSSKEHATNVGIMFRGIENALMPNYLHLPVAYHGRSSSIVVSETPIVRPCGQILNRDTNLPFYSKSKNLDYELEMAFIIGKNSNLGERVSLENSEDYIFGMALFNDWSARDIQNWEYVPLGPFLGKNFGSSISAWIVTTEALSRFKVNAPHQEVEVLSYLKSDIRETYDIQLEVTLQSNNGGNLKISDSNFKYLYWTQAQQLAHHTVNGCNIRVGDLIASGTISGKDRTSFGSLLELCWKGTMPITLDNGEERTYLEDGDTLTIKGFAIKDKIRVGFGDVKGTITEAKMK